MLGIGSVCLSPMVRPVLNNIFINPIIYKPIIGCTVAYVVTSPWIARAWSMLTYLLGHRLVRKPIGVGLITISICSLVTLPLYFIDELCKSDFIPYHHTLAYVLLSGILTSLLRASVELVE